MNLAFPQEVNTVVLDAGHGGHDTGAIGKNSREKDITLSIVLKLRDLINLNLPEVKVILTRDNDKFVELFRRAQIANSNNADLFISIHCNSIKSPSAYGVETFVMGLHKSEANLAVAKAENAAILLEDDYVEKYDGFDPYSPEGNIFFNMIQNSFLDRSLALAGKVQHQIVDNLNMFNRGVKQAGFLVLYKTAMPGVLIETGFISNPNDEKFLISKKGQDQMAEAIFLAFRDYKFKVENKIPLKPLADSLIALKPESTEIKAYSGSYVTDEKPAVMKADNTLFYRVQFAMYPEEKPLNSQVFKNIDSVKMYRHAGAYKYTSGDFVTLDEALLLRKKLVAKGYKDAFVVIFRNSERISNEEAKRLSEKK